ncbi:hypothetical protein EK904_007958 [Melospiza melodia maxima]|nr:hypothetical protein EK904_007958 [Melospiza melodia maxima]
MYPPSKIQVGEPRAHPCYLNDCCKRCIPVHGTPCTRALLGKGEAPKDGDPEPSANRMVLEEPGRKDGLCSVPLDPIITKADKHAKPEISIPCKRIKYIVLKAFKHYFGEKGV